MQTYNKINYYSKLLGLLQKMYKQKFNDKIPSTLYKLSKNFLTKYPKNIFFKIIEIKTFKEKADEELDKCFPGDFFPLENENFKYKIYQFLFQNSSQYENNESIINGIEPIINGLKEDGLIKKYIKLIDSFAQKMDKQNFLICELLVSNPYKYTELIAHIVSNLHINPLPNEAYDFYSMCNYESNIKNFKEYNKNTNIDDLRKEFLEKISQMNNKLVEQDKKLEEQDKKLVEQDKKLEEQDKKLVEQDKNISNLKQDLISIKDSLFNIQIRDIIKAFYKYLFLSLQVRKEEESIVKNVENAKKILLILKRKEINYLFNKNKFLILFLKKILKNNLNNIN